MTENLPEHIETAIDDVLQILIKNKFDALEAGSMPTSKFLTLLALKLNKHLMEEGAENGKHYQHHCGLLCSAFLKAADIFRERNL